MTQLDCWPSRQIRAMDCWSFAGFQSESNNINRFAPMRFRPVPPALEDNRNTYHACSHGGLFVQWGCLLQSHSSMLPTLTDYYGLLPSDRPPLRSMTIYDNQAGQAGWRRPDPAGRRNPPDPTGTASLAREVLHLYKLARKT